MYHRCRERECLPYCQWHLPKFALPIMLRCMLVVSWRRVVYQGGEGCWIVWMCPYGVKRVRCCIMLRIIGVFLHLPLLLIVLSPCNLYSSSTTIVMSTWNFYTLHTTLYYILYAESYNTIPGGRFTTAGWCIDMTWYDSYVMRMVRLNGCMNGMVSRWNVWLSACRLIIAFGRCSYGFERMYTGDGYGAKHNALWCSRIEAHTYIIYYIEWHHAPITYAR